jgi:hypothetical protein
MVNEAVHALGGSTSNIAVRNWIWERYPGTNRSTINCQLIAGCVNQHSRVHYQIDARPRPANNPALDRFYRPEKGKIELYSPERHGRWEIYKTEGGELSVREVALWPATVDVVSPAASTSMPGIESSSGVAADTDASMGAGEVAWVARLQPRLESALQSLSFADTRLRVDAGYRLPYAYEVMSYAEHEPEKRRTARYQTDLLIFDEMANTGTWVPRVIVECKIKGVTTHDALTYSGKAATHKQVHPYLRYGMLVGSYGSIVPARLVRHGAYFDFMAVWEDADPSKLEWEDLIDVLIQEVKASRLLQGLLSGGDKQSRAFRMVHRPLQLRGYHG